MNSEQFESILNNLERSTVLPNSDQELEGEFRRRRLREELRRLNDLEQFNILFPVAVKPQGEAPSYEAALLLRELSPACPLSCEHAVTALLTNWDVSIEEVPFYLASKFGPAHVKQAVSQLEVKIADEPQRKRLKTILYWLGIYEVSYEPITI